MLLNEKAKQWCSEHSNKKCKESCEGCWILHTPFGCEQHNMELAYNEGAKAMLDKACEWLLNHNDYLENPYANITSFNMAKLVADFRKAMEGE